MWTLTIPTKTDHITHQNWPHYPPKLSTFFWLDIKKEEHFFWKSSTDHITPKTDHIRPKIIFKNLNKILKIIRI